MSTNLWKQFEGALGRSPLRIMTITSVGSGTVTGTMSNGGTFVARGTGTVGHEVFIQDGEVRSEVSGLTTVGDQDV